MTTLHEHSTTSRHRTLRLLAVATSAVLVTASATVTAVAAPAATTTVGSWGPGVNAGGPGFTNQTIRQVVHVSAGGTAPRLRLSNLHGTTPLTIGHVDLATQATAGTATTGTHHQVTFAGSTSATIQPGREQLSDPVSMTVNTNQNLLVSVYVPGTTGASTWHPSSADTTYVSTTGDHATDDSTSRYPSTKNSWHFLSGLEVTSTTATGTLVAFGDSITDGLKSSKGTNRRYPDYLARRLATVIGGPQLGVVNAGISGNRVLTDAGSTNGNSALHRFAHDALAQPNVKDVILLEGINDITTNSTLTAKQLTDAYQTLITQAHQAGVAVYGGTITPFGHFSGYTTGRENIRQAVNKWIRTSGTFDGVADFDAAIRDPAETTRILPTYDSGDHLHPGDRGYQAMANAVNLAALRY
ncbi:MULTISPECIES: SGNH/GDSL hydrolase family protein [Amycolatopsis]|uniref:SGNH hydrolase n=1 Tax=Amycolatopsis bullii TaxID=941987 RepID=A0ABQ3KP01_9PSEU|nr:SGNH/GDSL hydrolase family protein [Amycolatopsis bullii]GHG41581.1 SGNH hydrolase [Amycolatopsis bullii]